MALPAICAIPASPFDTLYEYFPEVYDANQSLGTWIAGPPLPTCSSPQAFLPPPSRPPDAQDWINYKDVILDMYVTQDMKLPVVKQRMEEMHGFFASDKMYKDRFGKKKWNVRKYYSQQDVDDFLASFDPAQPLQAARIHDKPVQIRRILRRESEKRRTGSQRHYRRDSDASLTSSRVSGRTTGRSRANSAATPASSSRDTDSNFELIGPVTSIPEVLDTMQTGRITLSDLEKYLDEHLFQSMVGSFFGPIQTWSLASGHDQIMIQFDPVHPSQLNQNYTRGIALLKDGCRKPGIILLGQAAVALNKMFDVQHPVFASCLLDTFVEIKHSDQDIARGFVSDLVVQIAERVLGPNHPITALCRFVQRTTSGDDELEHLLWFCEAFCEMFARRLGKSHSISMYICLKHFEKLLQLGRYTAAQHVLVDLVEPAFAPMLSSAKMPLERRSACLCFLRRKAHVLRSLGDVGASRDCLLHALRFMSSWLQEFDASVVAHPVIEEIFRTLDEIAGFMEQNGDVDTAHDLHEFALELCIAVRGEQEGKTLRMVCALTRRYVDRGLNGKAVAMRLRFPDVFADQDTDPGYLGHSVHRLPCPNCGNGPDTQNWCEDHRLLEVVGPADRVRVQVVREKLALLVL